MATVSVIVPCYRAENHIANLVRQISVQYYQDFELIIVGNGDGQERQDAVIKSLLPVNPKIRYFSIPTGGVSAARNYGIDHAQGQWIMFSDADDEFSSDYISSFVAHAKNAEIISAGYDVTYDGVGTQHFPASHFDSDALGSERAYQELLKAGHTIGMVWCKMFSTRFLRDNNLRFDTNLTLCEDAVFCCKAFLTAKRFIVFPHCGYSYHRRQSFSALDRHHPCLLKSMREVDNLLSRMKRAAGHSEKEITIERVKKEYGWAIDEITGTFRIGSPHNFQSRLTLTKNWFDSSVFWESYRSQDKQSMSALNRILYKLAGYRSAVFFIVTLTLLMFARSKMGTFGRILQHRLATKK